MILELPQSLNTAATEAWGCFRAHTVCQHVQLQSEGLFQQSYLSAGGGVPSGYGIPLGKVGFSAQFVWILIQSNDRHRAHRPPMLSFRPFLFQPLHFWLHAACTRLNTCTRSQQPTCSGRGNLGKGKGHRASSHQTSAVKC